MSEPRVTALGTPCSEKWDDDWVAHVETVEEEVGHRICGAHSPAWTPCKLTSQDPNGRCRFHGGTVGIGAPIGNRNAMIHGLYSRRLQRCGKHCPLWFHCTLAGEDVLDLNAKERPTCFYEQSEYDALMRALTNAPDPGEADEPGGPSSTLAGSGETHCHTSTSAMNADDTDTSPNRNRHSRVPNCHSRAGGNLENPSQSTTDSTHSPDSTGGAARESRDSRLRGNDEGTDASSDSRRVSFSERMERLEREAEHAARPKQSPKSTFPFDTLVHHNIATFQIMLTRAQAAMSVTRMVEETHADGNNYSMVARKMSSMLQAEMRIARELRQWLKLLAFAPLRNALGAADPNAEPDEAPKRLGWAEIVAPILKKAEGVLEDSLEPST